VTMTESGPGTMREAVATVLAAAWTPDTTLRQWWEALASAGLSQPTWPVGLGGLGCRLPAARTVVELLGAAGTIGPPTGGIAVSLAAPTLLEHGTPDQTSRYLLPIARGEESWCQLFSEPGAGSDLAGLTTRAERDGERWVVTGQKVWNSSADIARRGLLLARTDPDAPKHRGITMFALDMDQPGVEVRPLRQMNGETNFCEVFIDHAVVGDDEVIGNPGSGWDVARTTLRHERQSVANRAASGLVAAASGEKAGMLDRRVGAIVEEAARLRPDRVSGYAVPAKLLNELARQRGRDTDPVLRDHLARYYTATRLNRMNTQRLRETGGRYPGSEGPLVKMGLVATCLLSAELVFEVLGAEGMLGGAEAPLGGSLHRSALGSPGARLGGGTDEIQRNVIGERGLGFPREPAAG
jgi:alkylation response protein AidB-like acyl-CoA dehydrogenase